MTRRPHWQADELCALLKAAVEKKGEIKGNFKSHSGGTADRELAWHFIQLNVNAVSHCRRSIVECQRKVQHFVSETKKKVCNE